MPATTRPFTSGQTLWHLGIRRGAEGAGRVSKEKGQHGGEEMTGVNGGEQWDGWRRRKEIGRAHV